MTSPIAVQLYSLREELAQDFAGVIEKVADIGYVGVEPYSRLPVSSAEAARVFDKFGLQVPSSHLSLPLGDDQQETLDTARAYGLKYIFVPWQPPERFQSRDSIRQLCDELNEAQMIVAKQGFTLGYHNHDFEYAALEDTYAYKIMLEYLDPAVLLQIDTYWVHVAGLNAAGIVQEVGSRAPSLHIKDGPADSREAAMLAVGTGVMDIPTIIHAGSEYTEWLVVELDRCDTDMMTAVEQSYQYLIKEGLARGNKN